jgi:glutaredoxin
MLGLVLVLTPAWARAADVVMYGAQWCPHCRELYGHLQARGVKFEYRDTTLANYKEELRRLSGSTSIPYTVIRGRGVLGAAIGRIDRLLAGAGLLPGGRAPAAGRAAPPPRAARKGRDRHPASWWRNRAALLQRRIAQLERQLAAQAAEKPRPGAPDVTAALQRQLDETRERLASLERDAARNGVPASALAAD